MKGFVLYNSLTKKKEVFEPFKKGIVGMYACGFTVYDHTHIGHIRKYVGDDILKRILLFNGYKVKHVQNVTDVGHLTSDADSGEDKLEKGAKKYKVDITTLARKFEEEFYDTLNAVNVLMPDVIERATSESAMKKQQELIQELLDNGYAYIRDSAIYFDVSKLSDYNPFSDQKLDDKIAGSREDVKVDPQKKNHADFVLWMFTKGEYKNHIMKWDSPWGVGFPGWHIECSAISMENLGEHIDIHTGGVDHLEVHHPNEIAQNEGVCGHRVVKYWVHHNFLQVNGKKMSKSLQNFYTLEDITNRGFGPLDLRYLVLGTHYRKQLNFTWQGLQSAHNALTKLKKAIDIIKNDKDVKEPVGNSEVEENKFFNEFRSAINDDMNMPVALSVVWNVIKSDESSSEKLILLSEFDKVLGLGLLDVDNNSNEESISLDELPSEVEELLEDRAKARKLKNWELSDQLRERIRKLGYLVSDVGDKQEISIVR